LCYPLKIKYLLLLLHELDQHANISWILIVLAHRNNSLHVIVDMSFHMGTLKWFKSNQSLLHPYIEERNTICLGFGLTQTRDLLILHLRWACWPLHTWCSAHVFHVFMNSMCLILLRFGCLSYMYVLFLPPLR
jgi:hypothetical protein